MRILAVSNELSVLAKLSDVLGTVFPDAEVVRETDPLMACKYSFHHEVDCVFASEEMKRMSGSDLLQFIRKEHPSVRTYLIFRDASALPMAICDESDGAIGYPFSAEELKEAINGHAAIGI